MTDTTERDRKYTWLLSALVALIVVSPFLERRDDSWLLTALSAGVLIAVIFVVRGHYRRVWFAGLLAVANLGVNLLTMTIKAPLLAFADGVLGLVFFGFATWVVYTDVMSARRVSADTLAGAVCVYLLLGASFGLLYYSIELLAPGSFSVSATPASAAGAWAELHYFSFVTLTTVGYGDLSPLTDQARSLAIVEGIAGQLYLAVLVARLVGKFQQN